MQNDHLTGATPLMLNDFSDEAIQAEADRRHRIKMRFHRAADYVRDSARDKKMTVYQAIEACEFLVKALGLSQEKFADAVLSHVGVSGYFSPAEWPGADSATAPPPIPGDKPDTPRERIPPGLQNQA